MHGCSAVQCSAALSVRSAWDIVGAGWRARRFSYGGKKHKQLNTACSQPRQGATGGVLLGTAPNPVITGKTRRVALTLRMFILLLAGGFGSMLRAMGSQKSGESKCTAARLSEYLRGIETDSAAQCTGTIACTVGRDCDLSLALFANLIMLACVRY